ncbi:protein TBATA isoform X1 [Odocoileus virginianus]|uniref:Protein TBATA isoform X1 n=2 Tax=Odocoileus virginianus TaxID=9874 RepID=A0A6J0W7D3_ODOVR
MATEVRAQLAEHSLPSPKAEPKLEKKSGCQPRSHGDSGPQKELTIPGTVDFELIREAVRTSKPQTPSAYRFGRLSHHSFFSRHHPQPQHVTHIQDLTGKPVCVVRDKLALATSPQATLLPGYLIRMPTISVPVGDPQSNRDPRLYSEAWKKELKDLASQVAIFTKESELKSKEQKKEPQREQGAKYSAETGRLIPASTRAMARRHSHQGRNQPASRDGGDQTFLLQDQELLGGLTLPGSRFSGPMGRGHRAGLQELHHPLQAPALHGCRRHRQQPSLGSPRSPPQTGLDLLPRTLYWRTQWGKGPEVAKMWGVEWAEEAPGSKDSPALGRKGLPIKWCTELAGYSPEAVHRDQSTSLLTSPDSELGRFRERRPVRSLKFPHQGPRQSGLDPGTAFANSADRLLECYPVLATLCACQGERHGTGAPADRGGSAPSPTPSVHPSRKTPEPAPGSSRLTSREAPATLQPIPEEDEDTTSIKKRTTREHWQSSSSSRALQPEPRREGSKGRELRSLRLPQEKPLSSKTPSLSPQQQYWFSYHVEPIKLLSSP